MHDGHTGTGSRNWRHSDRGVSTFPPITWKENATDVPNLRIYNDFDKREVKRNPEPGYYRGMNRGKGL